MSHFQVIFICKFLSVEKFRNLKYSLSLIIQDFLGDYANDNFMSLESYLNTGYTYIHVCMCKSVCAFMCVYVRTDGRTKPKNRMECHWHTRL